VGGKEIVYPNDDVRAILEPNGGWRFVHIDGSLSAKCRPCAGR
jgi:hypothetical protein